MFTPSSQWRIVPLGCSNGNVDHWTLNNPPAQQQQQQKLKNKRKHNRATGMVKMGSIDTGSCVRVQSPKKYGLLTLVDWYFWLHGNMVQHTINTHSRRRRQL